MSILIMKNAMHPGCFASKHLFLPAWVLIEFFAPHAAISGDMNSTVSITKTLPSGIQTVKAPDMDRRHYRVQEGTHFSYRCHISYTWKTKQAAVEICEIDPVTLQIISWPETEVINIIQGQVNITEVNGSIKTYAEGDIFVLPQGFKGIWRQSGKLLKVVVRHPLYWKD